MAFRSVPCTASGSIAFQRRYVADSANYTRSGWLVVQGELGTAGITDPLLAEPIDFPVKLAERSRDGVPIEPVDTDTTNDAFGI